MASGKEKKTSLLSVRVGPNLKKMLEGIAEEADRSTSYIVAQILEEYLRRNHPGRLGEAEYDLVKEGEARYVSESDSPEKRI